MKVPTKRRILVGGSAATLAGALAAVFAVGTAGHDAARHPGALQGVAQHGSAAQARQVADPNLSPGTPSAGPSTSTGTGTGTGPANSSNPTPSGAADVGHGTLDSSTREQLNFKNTSTFTGMACADYGGPNGLCSTPVNPGDNAGLEAYGVTPASAGLLLDFYVGTDFKHPFNKLHVAFDHNPHCFLFEGTPETPSIRETTCNGF